MKRDMDLVRRILLAVAEMPHHEELQSLDGVDDDDFAQHAEWLHEAGLVAAAISHTTRGTHALIFRLTWNGCDFVDAIRDDTLWKKAKDNVMKPSMSFTFDVLKEWLKTEITQGLPTIRALGQ